jgi:GH15 family glucan-1,4-alpha-glucosidase
MCWVAVDRGSKIARITGEDGKAAEWELAAQEIKDDILTNGVDERGVLTQYYGSKALDASLLLAPLVRFLPADHPVIRATVLAIADELTVHELVLRYRVEETDDGFSGEEGSFTICSFWLVSALCEIGEYERARKLCAKLLSFAGALDLYGEEIDPHTGQQLGNFPQPSPTGADQRRNPCDQARRVAARPRTRHMGRVNERRDSRLTQTAAAWVPERRR